MVTFDEEKQNKRLQELRLKEQEDLARLLSEKYGAPYIDLSTTAINTDALRLVEEEVSREARLAPFQINGKVVSVATVSPEKENTALLLKQLQEQGLRPEIYIASPKSLEHAWERYAEMSYSIKTQEGVLDIGSKQVEEYTSLFSKLPELQKALQETLGGKSKYQTSGLLEMFIAGAIGTKASDIHFEPKEGNAMVRFRLDGVLVDLVEMDTKIFTLLLSRIKLISGLKINVRDEAQDGRFSIKFKDTEIEIRTSVIPGAYGESIVLRVLNPETIATPLEELGMSKQFLELLEREVRKPNGMILNTGPTGSGKTTTLYAILRKLSTPDIKIITIEDPIEYHIPRITQTQTDEKEGYTFLEGLRSALRQDPDIIMVGEIRDDETAGTAVNAALTGHLVLSTLHTNTAAGAIPRLIDLNVNPKIIGSSLNVVLAQRLVRKLCEECKKQVEPSAEQKALMEKVSATMPEKYRVEIGPIWETSGCDKCNGTGFKGRTGIFEMILMDGDVENIITQNPSEREIRKLAHEKGFLTMQQDGLIKILSGVTSLEEVSRVVDMMEDVS